MENSQLFFVGKFFVFEFCVENTETQDTALGVDIIVKQSIDFCFTMRYAKITKKELAICSIVADIEPG